MLNLIVLLGRLTRDPELKVSGDTTIVNFNLAVDNVRKDAKGERGTSFFKVTVFNNIADNVSKHLNKGSKVAITGTIQERRFLRQDGSQGSTYEVYADSVEFLDPKPKEELGEDILVPEAEVPADNQPKYDPMTGKPLKPNSKK